MKVERSGIESMSAVDALLYRGDEHPRGLSATGALCLLDGSPTQARVMQALERASRAFPRLRQRVIAPSLRVQLPRWVTDPDFDPGDHVRRVDVARPGTLSDVLDATLPALSAPLDDDRPLWEAILLDGREGGGALLFRMSHAVTDGIGALRLFAALFDAGPVPQPKRLAPVRLPGHPVVAGMQQHVPRHMPDELLGEALRAVPGLVRAARSAVRNPASVALSAGHYVASMRRVMGLPCPSAPALDGRSPARRCAVLEVPLPPLKRAARRLGGSINDLCLAAVAGALREYQIVMGFVPADVPLAIPVNLRERGESAAGNYIGAITLALPASEADPARRLDAIRSAVRASRGEPAIRVHSRMAPVLARVPDTVLERVLKVVPRADVQVSNLPGPAERPWFAGRRVSAVFPFGPVPGVGAMITFFSLAGTCFLAMHFDPASIARPEVFATCLRQGFAAVLMASGQPGAVGALGAPVLDHGPSPAPPDAGGRATPRRGRNPSPPARPGTAGPRRRA